MASGSRQDGCEASACGKSEVWKYFEKIQGANKAKCTLCSRELAYRGGTTNLRDHLASKHPLNYEPQEKKSQGKRMQGTLDTFAKPRYCSESRAAEITERIVNMVALDMRPVHVVECEGFRDLLRCLEPGYTIPSRKHVTKLLRRKHDIGKEQLQAKLGKDAVSIALTTDIWTSSTTEAYITVSAHYTSPCWELCSCVLGTPAFPEQHTGRAIADKLIEIVRGYSLSEKVSVVVHDQAANMELCLEILEVDQGWKSLKCTAHCLQLYLKAGLSISGIDRLIGVARKLVGHFRHSVVASEELKRRQAQMKVAEKKLIQDCATRWNSSFYMLERLLEMRWPVTAVLSCEGVTKRSDRYLDLSSDNWALADELVKALQPFEVATTFHSYKENASLSCVLLVLHGLIESLQKSPPDEDLPLVRQFKVKVASEIKRRWKLDSIDTISALVLTPVIDPRLKLLKFLDQEQAEVVRSELITRMESFSTPAPSDSNATTAIEPAAKKQRKETALDILLGPEESMLGDRHSADELEEHLSEKLALRKVILSNGGRRMITGSLDSLK